MKLLTIQQPYASLVASGEKWVENRTWPTSHRGWLAIHAGKGTRYLSQSELASYPTGGVIAIAKLVACEHIETIVKMFVNETERHKCIPGSTRTWDEVSDHAHTEGDWCWILEDIVKLKEVALAKGVQRLGDWIVNKEVLDLVVSKRKPIGVIGDVCL